MPTTAQLHPRPADATLTVARAAHVLGVHPNTIRAWSDAGRLRYYRINPRGDRRYRLGDLQRFLANAADGTVGGARTSGRRAASGGAVTARSRRRPMPPRSAAGRSSAPLIERSRPRPNGNRADLDVLAGIGRIGASAIREPVDPEVLLGSATRIIREGGGFRRVSAWRLQGDRLIPVAVSGPPDARLVELPRGKGLMAAALDAPGSVSVADPAATTDAARRDGPRDRRRDPGP